MGGAPDVRAVYQERAEGMAAIGLGGDRDLRAVRDESGVVDAAHLDAAADGGGDRHRMGDRVGGEEGGNDGVLRDREGAGVGGHLRAVHQEVGEFVVIIRRGGEGDAAVGRGRAVRAEHGRGDRAARRLPDVHGVGQNVKARVDLQAVDGLDRTHAVRDDGGGRAHGQAGHRQGGQRMGRVGQGGKGHVHALRQSDRVGQGQAIGSRRDGLRRVVWGAVDRQGAALRHAVGDRGLRRLVLTFGGERREGEIAARNRKREQHG